jgi:hypothetical protein
MKLTKRENLSDCAGMCDKCKLPIICNDSVYPHGGLAEFWTNGDVNKRYCKKCAEKLQAQT